MARHDHESGADRLRKRALFVAGSISLALGVIGIFVPLLPTTPFLLLAAACYLRSSPRAHRWLMANRFLGGYIKRYQSGEGMPIRAKVAVIGLLWLTIGFSAIYVVDSTLVRALLVLIALAVSTHILSIRTYRRCAASAISTTPPPGGQP